MGLHNKFPSDFYKRGNLFNTFLGSGEEAVKLPARKARQTTYQKRSQVEKQPRQLTHREALISFIQRYLTLEQMEAWRKCTGEAHGVAVSPAPHIGMAYSEVDAVIRAHIPPATCARYLEELKRRLETGSPLVRS
jgi:hypothetical protein